MVPQALLTMALHSMPSVSVVVILQLGSCELGISKYTKLQVRPRRRILCFVSCVSWGGELPAGFPAQLPGCSATIACTVEQCSLLFPLRGPRD